MWNNLPNEVVTAESVNGFKNNLDKHWENDPLKLDYRYEEKTDEDEE